MKALLTLLLFLLLVATTAAQPRWSYLGLGERATYSIAIQGNDLFAGTDAGVFTKPRGFLDTTWTSLGPDSLEVRSLLFLDSMTMFAGGLVDSEDVWIASLYRSGNRGASWEEIPVPSQVFSVNSLDAHPAVPDTVYACGSLRCMKSIDGGSTWSLMHPYENSWGIVHVSRSDPLAVWAGGESFLFAPFLSRSADGGRNWSINISPTPSSENRVLDIEVDPVNDDYVYLGMEGFFEKSTDGGATWSVKVGNQFRFEDVELDPHDLTRLYATGRAGAGLPAPGLILYVSEDRGESWTYLNHMPWNGTSDAWSLEPIFEGDSVAVYIGATGGVYRVGHFETVGASEGPAVPHTTSLAPPLVRAGSVSIHYALSNPAAVDLAVYDVAGRLVHLLEQSNKEPGEYELSWRLDSPSGGRVAGGVYFLRLEAGPDVLSRKIVIRRR